MPFGIPIGNGLELNVRGGFDQRKRGVEHELPSINIVGQIRIWIDFIIAIGLNRILAGLRIERNI